MKKILFVALASLSLIFAGSSMAAGDKAKGKELSTTCAACMVVTVTVSIPNGQNWLSRVHPIS